MIDVENYYVTDNTRRLWNVELDMADVLLKVCQRFNLRIWAYFGTLLRAARHKGFIPWNDDLDKPYEVFIKERLSKMSFIKRYALGIEASKVSISNIMDSNNNNNLIF